MSVQSRVLILRSPGTNCDVETAYAFELAGGKAERWHINRLLEAPKLLADFQVLCIPGGFSYGDDVAAGKILANQIQHHLADDLRKFKSDGKLILGICNGFQVLIKSGLLLDNDPNLGPPATLTWNDSGRFEDRWVRLSVHGSKCIFLRGIDSMLLPVAHAEGKFVPRDGIALEGLAREDQLVLKYRPLRGANGPGIPYPDNPNGSIGDIAGVCDTTGRVFGLMPHPERHIDPTQNPQWTRGDVRDAGDGIQVFRNAIGYFV
jgi:phosphoribosylformylglycinamidine synthase